MSLRKISDLPNVKGINYSLQKFKESLIEVSYKTIDSPTNTNYTSKYMIIGDFAADICSLLSNVTIVMQDQLLELSSAFCRLSAEYHKNDREIVITEESVK